MPFAASSPVLYYNKTSFTKAGLDPNVPPTIVSELAADATALKRSGTGLGLVLDDYYLKNWLALDNQPLVNHGNGRTSRSSATTFDTPTGIRAFSALDELVTSKAATTNSASGPDRFNDLLGLANGKYGMAIDGSAALGTIESILKGGQYPNVALGVAPFPSLTPHASGGIIPQGGGIFMMAKTSPAQRSAAWSYIEFLDSTQSQAQWGATTGYIPLRYSSAATDVIKNLWTTNPAYKISFDQLASGRDDNASRGALLGPYESLSSALLGAELSMFQQGTSPPKALQAAAQDADSAIHDYNERIG
jgi:sn-glycerol 3-phosphate transport system substrate-binding protein